MDITVVVGTTPPVVVAEVEVVVLALLRLRLELRVITAAIVTMVAVALDQHLDDNKKIKLTEKYKNDKSTPMLQSEQCTNNPAISSSYILQTCDHHNNVVGTP